MSKFKSYDLQLAYDSLPSVQKQRKDKDRKAAIDKVRTEYEERADNISFYDFIQLKYEQGEVDQVYVEDIQKQTYIVNTLKLYIVQSGNRPYYKIGITEGYRLNTRLTALQTGNPDKLCIYKYAFLKEAKTEKECQEYLKDYGTHGEWFHIEDVELLELMAKKFDLELRDDYLDEEGRYKNLFLVESKLL